MNRIAGRGARHIAPLTLAMILMVIGTVTLCASSLFEYHGDRIPAHVERMYTTGLGFLVKTQASQGCWADNYGRQPGVVGLAVVAMLAHGDDPESGPYAAAIRKALNFICDAQEKSTGYIGTSMYNHGFATLALAEAYGTVENPKIGPALKKAVDLILSSQKRNPMGAWRYSPETQSADTTVSGAQVVALLAARNAGIEVPDKSIKTALDFYRTTQNGAGGFGYSSAGSSSASQSAIGSLVFALAKEKDTTAFKAGFRNLKQFGQNDGGRPYYYRYYASQAMFHGDMAAWKTWSGKNEDWLRSTQMKDGGWQGNMGSSFATSSALLSLALHYRYLPIYER